eukprot:TRINITY_DN22905_c0_g1_i1.p2 TRINITY_DN22905_c0_g1~~TRINITY_DN22905_c0_g1_i1.p2  ORF type:complete len:158 (-),score=17.37 TRINITY_DN22905_c0_g1_i1:612-1085(-)
MMQEPTLDPTTPMGSEEVATHREGTSGSGSFPFGQEDQRWMYRVMSSSSDLSNEQLKALVVANFSPARVENILGACPVPDLATEEFRAQAIAFLESAQVRTTNRASDGKRFSLITAWCAWCDNYSTHSGYRALLPESLHVPAVLPHGSQVPITLEAL